MKLLSKVTMQANGYWIVKNEIYEHGIIHKTATGKIFIIIPAIGHQVAWDIDLFTEIDGMPVVADPLTFSPS